MTGAGEPVLRVESAVKRYGETVALDRLSLSVEGGIVGLLGANGAGKTTLLRAVLHLVALDRGRVLVDGLDAARRPVEVRRRIGYLPEDLVLYDRLTGWEHLAFFAGIKGLDNRDERRAMLAAWGLEGAAHRLVGGYSLGMRKKIGLAAALMGSPRLVLLDEPLNGLDAASMRRLRLILEERAAAGTTFVLSSHTMAFIERVCGRVVVLRRGRLAADGAPSALAAALGMGGEPFEDVFLRLVEEGAAEGQEAPGGIDRRSAKEVERWSAGGGR